MSDIEDDISLGIFSGNFYLQDNIGSETTHYKRYNQLESVEHNAIYGQVLKLLAAAHIFLIAGFTLGCRPIPWQPVCRGLNCDLFAFFKNHSRTSRRDSRCFSNIDTVFNLAQPNAPDVSGTF